MFSNFENTSAEDGKKCWSTINLKELGRFSISILCNHDQDLGKKLENYRSLFKEGSFLVSHETTADISTFHLQKRFKRPI